ncbi:hypothetical protein SLEP1_g53149 [Rubroshorea leprosula]|uniref:Integrase catalytic domain-containing protein n=1 Tax=Rubroshorea leprosula TaxID=152421 RepID=A0AAV5M9L4_9ROSI|nr:hypothetical protein SLEP1_g53149 [Rubroshorea leprosula]
MLREEKPKLQPNQETETINLGIEDDRKEIKINAHLSSKERKELIKLLFEFQDVFAWSYKDMPGLDLDIIVHAIPLYFEAKPVKQKLRRMKSEVLLKVKEEVQKLLDVNFIEVAMYPEWVANIVPVMKKDGRVRVCVDYRDLNKASPKDDFPLPHIQILLDNAAKNARFSFVDGYFGYNQIRMKEEDKLKTTFITQWGTFCYKVMPFGLKNAGATYQCSVITLLHDFVHTIIKLYVDDMVIMSKEEVLHTKNLKKVFECLRKYQMRLNLAKCTFDVDSGKLLGFIVSRPGIEIDPAKIKAIDEMLPPKNQKEVRSFLGRINYIARVIANLTTICEPISKLLRKDSPHTWNDQCQQAFDKIKEYLKNPPILVPPTDKRPFILYITVLEESMGAILVQHDDLGKRERAIYYAIKGQAIADHLAEHATEDYEPIDWDFLDEDILAVEAEFDSDNWKLFFDGAVNQLGCGLGAVLVSPKGDHFPIAIKLDFACTNNIAEYEACIVGIHVALDMNVRDLEIYGDLALIICQTKGDWQTKDPKLIPYHQYLETLIKKFRFISLNHMPRTKNQFVDALATLASMIQISNDDVIKPLMIEISQEPTHCMEIKVDDKPWFHDIKQFLQNGEYPLHASEVNKKTIRKLATSYFLSDNTLYKRSADMTLFRCVDETEVGQVMIEVHEGICGTHANGRMLARKILRAGYYWLTMEHDRIKYARACHKCQIYADHINAPPSLLIICSLLGHSSLEAASYASVTKKVVTRFIKKEIICKYGQPKAIITDNASNLNNDMMTALCKQFKIKHLNSSPYQPKMNGVVEAANKNTKKILAKMTVTYKDWHEMLPYTLHAYRTFVRTSTGATPYSLVYGMEATLPIELEIPSMRILSELGIEEEDLIQKRVDHLNLLDEKRLAALCHSQCYQRRMATAYNKKLKPRVFHQGDLILRKIMPNEKDLRGKFAPNYEGPYVVKEAFSGGALLLKCPDGTNYHHPVNANAVKIRRKRIGRTENQKTEKSHCPASVPLRPTPPATPPPCTELAPLLAAPALSPLRPCALATLSLRLDHAQIPLLCAPCCVDPAAAPLSLQPTEHETNPHHVLALLAG